MDVLVFHLGPQAFAIPLTHVEQVFAVAEIAPPSDPSGAIRGAVDVHGEVTPVADLGRGDTGSWTELTADQQFILVNAPTRRLIYLADAVEGVRMFPDGAAIAANGLTYIDDAP